jgi:hypothetical protein
MKAIPVRCKDCEDPSNPVILTESERPEGSEDEWKDPDALSFTMSHQGVLPTDHQIDKLWIASALGLRNETASLHDIIKAPKGSLPYDPAIPSRSTLK